METRSVKIILADVLECRSDFITELAGFMALLTWNFEAFFWGAINRCLNLERNRVQATQTGRAFTNDIYSMGK